VEPQRTGLIERIISNPSLVLPVLAITLNFGLTLFAEFVSLQNFAYSTDEYSYLVSANLMAQGRLWVPSPEPRQFFDLENIVNDGRYYGKYPPGWPALLSLGVRIGAPWLLAPMMGAASLAMIYAIARRHFSVEMANVALISMLFCPYFVFNSASYFSHTPCLLPVLLFCYAYLESLKHPERLLPFASMGLFAGLGFIIRPFTVVGLSVVPAVHLIWWALRTKQILSLLKGLPLAMAGSSVFLIPFFVYNHSTTGSFLRQPYEAYNPGEKLSLPTSLSDVAERVRTHFILRLLHLARWFPQAPLLLLLAWKTRIFKDDARLGWLVLTWAGLLAAYFGFYHEGGFQYGPRYIYEGFPFLLLASSAGLLRIGRAGPIVLGFVVAFNAGSTALRAKRFSAEIASSRRLYELAAAPELANSVVFLNRVSSTMKANNCTRNGTRFDGPVLFVQDLGVRNPELLRRYPDRKAYTYVFDSESDTGRLVPYEGKKSSSD